MYIYLLNLLYVNFLYIITLFFLEKFNNVFNSLELNKKMYVVKNIVKSIVLLYISVSGTKTLVQYLNTDNYDMKVIRYYASWYVSNDITALAVVKNLPITTKIHHSITTCLLFYTMLIDYNYLTNPGKLLLIYTIMSCYTFMVNFYLGIRFLKKKDSKNRLIKYSRYYSYYTYVGCCMVNWSIHFVILMNRLINFQYNIQYLIYTGMLYFIIKDDLILMSWLKN